MGAPAMLEGGRGTNDEMVEERAAADEMVEERAAAAEIVEETGAAAGWEGESRHEMTDPVGRGAADAAGRGTEQASAGVRGNRKDRVIMGRGAGPR